MSFLLDPMLLIGAGFGLALLSKTKGIYKKDGFFIYWMSLLTLGVFLALSIGLFVDGVPWFTDLIRGFFNPALCQTGTQFMFSSGMFEVPFVDLLGLIQYPEYVFWGIMMFVTYPGWLYLGTQLGYLTFGRKPGDKGIIYLL